MLCYVMNFAIDNIFHRLLLRMSSIKRKCEFDMTSEAERRPTKSTWNQTGLMLYFLINILSIAFFIFSEGEGSDSVSHCEHSIDADHCAVKFLKTFPTFFLILIRPRSVSVCVLAIRYLQPGRLQTDPSTSGAPPKLVTGWWSGFFAKSKFASGHDIRDSITTSLP